MMISQKDSESVLQFEGVKLSSRSMDSVTMTVHPGEFLMVRLEDQDPVTPFCDLAEGLLAPVEGRISFRGRAWVGMGDFEQDNARGMIGRVFAGEGWISNLSIYENICLRLAYHTTKSELEIREAIDSVARSLKIDTIPDARPESVSSLQLRHLSWVRALVGDPVLVLLEQPEKGASRARVDNLFAVATQMCSNGTSLVWLTADETVWKKDMNNQRIRRYLMVDGSMKEYSDGR